MGPINESLSSDSPIEAIGDDDSERTTAGVACSSSSVLSSSSRSSVLSSYISDDRKLVDDEERRESESLPESAREEEIGPENRPLHNKDDGDLQVLVQGIKTCKGSSALTDSPFNGNWLHLDKRVRNLQNRGRDDVFFSRPLSLPTFPFESDNSREENDRRNINHTDIETNDKRSLIGLASRMFILKTTYPSDMYLEHQKYPVVCNADGIPNKALDCMKLVAQTYKILPPRTGFLDLNHAVDAAGAERDQCPEFSCFWDADAPLPWDLSPLNNTGRDADVIIDVVGYNQLVNTFHSQREARDYLDEKYGCYEKVLEMEESAMRVAAAGVRAFYLYPVRKFWDKPADMEIRETANWRKDMLQKIRPDSRSMSSLMYRGHKDGSLGRFLDDVYNFRHYDASEVGISRHLQCIDKLEELFLEMNIARKNEGQVETLPSPSNFQHYLADQRPPVSKHFILHLAPQLKNLKVLSFGIGFKLLPQTLITISDTMVLLERLDISHALSVEYS